VVTPKEPAHDYYGPSNAAWLWKMDLTCKSLPPSSTTRPRADGDSSKNALSPARRWSIGGGDHRTLVTVAAAMQRGRNFAAAGLGSLTWEDAEGTRWVLSPSGDRRIPTSKFRSRPGNPRRSGRIQGGRAGRRDRADAGLTSRDMDQAEPPVIANGVVYAERRVQRPGDR
jgi:hypothetical protein